MLDSPRLKKAEGLLSALSDSKRVPLKEMESLIELGRKDPGVSALAAERLRMFAYESPFLWRGWLAIVCGELDREGLLACLDCVGRNDDTDPDVNDGGLNDDLLIPPLMRGTKVVLEEILVAIHRSESKSTRGMLYEVLNGVLLGKDEEAKERLLIFGSERLHVEMADSEGRSNVIDVLTLLHGVGADVIPMVRGVAKWGHEDGLLQGEVNDLENIVTGQVDALEASRGFFAMDWRENAIRVSKLMGQ